jgi:hypothetical protein
MQGLFKAKPVVSTGMRAAGPKVAGGRASGFDFPYNLPPETYNLRIPQPATYELSRLPQIESRFPIRFPNSARNQSQYGMATAPRIFRPLLESRKSNMSNTLRV